MLLRSLHIASRQLFYLTVVSIILALLGVIGAVWLSEQIAVRKDEIAAWASDKTGYPITIDSAGLYWFDLIPKLEVRQIALLQKTANVPVATANQLYLSLDILASIEQGEPVVADVSIDGVNLSIERSAEGQFELIGLEAEKHHYSVPNVPELVHRFTWLKQLQLTDINLNYTDLQQASLSGNYSLKQAEVGFSANSWQIAAQVLMPEQLGNKLDLTGQVEIHPDYSLKSWQARLVSDQMNLSPASSSWELNGAVIESGRTSFVLQAVQERPNHLMMDLNLAATQVLLAQSDEAEDSEKISIERLAGSIQWQSNNNRWQLKSDGLQLQISGEAWPLTSFVLKKHADEKFQLETNYLRLSPLIKLATMFSEMPEPLLATKPAGEVENLSLDYDLQQGLTAVQMKATDIAMLPWQEYPGINGLNFDLEWNQQQGKLVLDSHKTDIYADSWLNDAVFLDSLSGQLSWQQQESNWHVLAENLRAWNDDFSLELDGRVNRQHDQLDSELTLTMQDVVVNRWLAYVPERILPAEFGKWAKQAFKEGLIKTGSIKLQGDPSAFPFDTQPDKGAFDMQLQVENVQLHYAPDWPDITAVNGSISGQGNNLLIKSQVGEIAGFAFNDVTTTISNLVRPKPILRVDGTLSGTTAQALNFLTNSPLKQRFGSIPAWIQAEGKSDIALQLMVPLVDSINTVVSGNVSFIDSSLTTKAVPGLDISKVNGQLKFNNDGVTAEQMKAVIFDEPVSVSVHPEYQQTVINVEGKASTKALKETWDGVIPDFVLGQADYLTKIKVRELQQGVFDIGVEVNSDLQGIEIATPAPLYKPVNQKQTFRLQIEQNQSDNLLYKLSLDNWLNASVSFDDNVISGQVMLGGEPAIYQQNGLSIRGHLPELDLDPWLAWQSNRADKQSNLINGFSEMNLSLDKLFLRQQQIEDLHVIIKPTDTDWQIKLDANQVRGDVVIPQDLQTGKALDIRLDYLNLLLAETKPTTDLNNASELWPSMSVAINDFQVDGMQLGQLNLEAKRQPQSWKIESASLETPVMTAIATGQWTKNDSTEHSQFDVELSSEDLKAVLAYYNYQQAIEAQNVKVTANLSWAGEPTAFSRQLLQGDMELSVGRGRLLDVEPGAAGRIFGLLSIAAIPRRLALDFNDLFNKGFDFSSITGKFNFAKGIARTENLTMQGDSALIEVTGPVDIVDKTYNQIVKVTPKVASALPLAGAVAGGPIGLGVGTAILIADKLVGTLFDQNIVDIISYSYQLSGPWDDPKLNIVNPATN